MARTQRVCIDSTPGDARKAAEVVAEALRKNGELVEIGPEYTVPFGHKAGMLAVDLVISTPPPPESVSADAQVAPVIDSPSVETSSVVMATTDGFDEEIVPLSDEPTPTLAEEYPSLVTPPVVKNKGGRPRKVEAKV